MLRGRPAYTTLTSLKLCATIVIFLLGKGLSEAVAIEKFTDGHAAFTFHLQLLDLHKTI